MKPHKLTLRLLSVFFLLLTFFVFSCRNESSSGSGNDVLPDANWIVNAFMEEVKNLDPKAEVIEVGDFLYEGTRGDGSKVERMTLANLIGECRDVNKAACIPAIQRYAKTFLRKAPDQFTTDQLRLALFGKSGLLKESPDVLKWGNEFAGDLMLFLVAETEDQILTISPEKESLFEMERDSLMATARKNMTEKMLPLRYGKMENLPVWYLDTSIPDGPDTDSFDAARIVLHSAWKDLAELVKGDLIAAAPARDFAFFTGTEDKQGPISIAHVAKEIYQGEPHPISTEILRWTEAGWEVFEN
ncbi:MAG: hypothetical protein AAF570_02035 [Bacteroidota bacterium]